MSATRTILLVDDSPDGVEALDARLRALGYRTALAQDGAEAIEVMRADPADLVVLDAVLPELNGFQACRAIKKLRRTTPVILLAARAEPADRYWARECGADLFLARPVEASAVVLRIAELLGDP